MNVATRGMRNAFRNFTRTLSIVVVLGLSIGLSLIMLIAHQSVQSKITASLSSIGNKININPAGSVANIKGNNLTAAQLEGVAKLPHITNLTEIFTDKLQTNGSTIDGGNQRYAKTSLDSPLSLDNNGTATDNGGAPGASVFPVVFVVGTNRPADPSNVGASSLQIVSGAAINGNKNNNEAMVSSSMAAKNNLTVGSTFTAYGQTLTVAAIFNSNTDSGNSYIIVSLPAVQRLSDSAGAISNAIATVDSLTNLGSATSAIKGELGSSADVTSDITQASDTLAPLTSVKNVSLYSLIGAVVAGAIIVLLTMIMIVRERRREIGILKAIGLSNIRIMLQFVCEALTLTVLGAVIGVIIGLAGGSPVTSTLVSNSSNHAASSHGNQLKHGTFGFNGPTLGDITAVHTQIGYTIIVYGLTAAILIALIGSALASYFISRVRPAEVLRSE